MEKPAVRFASRFSVLTNCGTIALGRGRRPRRPPCRRSRLGEMNRQDEMNMVGHDDIFIHRDVRICFVHFLKTVRENGAVIRQLNGWGVEDAAPYNVSKQRFSFRRTDGDKIRTVLTVIVSGQSVWFSVFHGQPSLEVNRFPISSATRANPGISSVSPRTFSAKPTSRTHRMISSLGIFPNPAHSPFTSVFRRWAKLAFTTRKNSFSSEIGQGGSVAAPEGEDSGGHLRLRNEAAGRHIE